MNTNPTERGSGGGAERRRYVRLPIRLDALVAIDGRPAIPCTVRDFCVAGIFVAISPQQLRLVKANTSATLFFALVVDGVQSDYQLTLTIFRVVGSGFGCGFQDADPQTISLLQSFAASANPHAVLDTPEALSQTQSNFSDRFAALQKPLLDRVERFSKRTCEEFLSMVDEALFLAARDAKNNREETRFLDGQNEIRSRSNAIKENVPKLLSKGVSILNSPLNLGPEEPATPTLSELSLIDKEEFEEFLTVSQLVSELDLCFKDPLYQLDRRFSALANREVDERSNPLGPAVVGGVFAEELKNLQSDRSAVNIIYRTLRKVLEVNLDLLYTDANALLVENGILPVIEKEKKNFKREASATSPPPSPEALERTTGGSSVTPGAGTDFHNQPPPQGYPQAGHGPGGVPSGVQPHVQAAPPPVFVAPPAPYGAPPVTGNAPGQAHAGGFNVIDPAAANAYPTQGAGAPVQYGNVPPGVPAQAAPDNAPPAGSVHAAAPQPSIPPGPVQAGAPGVSGGVTPFGMGLEATFGGFGTGPAIYVPPSLQQAYSAAQAQMALRRELSPVSSSEAMSIGAAGPVYGQAQVIDGLTQLQHALANTQERQTLDVQNIKQRIVEAIARVSGEDGSIGQAESDAIEVIANLFEVLIEDALLTDTAKNQLSKLQAPVHKVALMDPAFFETTDHPVRQLLNRVSMLRDSDSDGGGARNATVSELIGRTNTEFDQNVDMFRPILSEFDQILREQRDAYNDKVSSVVRESEEQQKILSARREKNLEATDSSLAQNDLPEEWNRWLERGKMLEAGERMVMNANTPKPSMVTLVWIGPGFNPYVFVDERGERSSTLTLQQVAMFLRRGTLKQLQDDDEGAVDRALFGVVNRMHGEVEARATHDELTDFMNRKTFLQALERHLPERGAAGGAVLSQISLGNLKEINDRYGVEAGDEMLNGIAQRLRDTITGKAVSFGRLSGTELGVFWHKGGLQNAYKKLQSCFETISEFTVEVDGNSLRPTAYAGITVIDDGLTAPAQLLSLVGDACNAAKLSKGKPIYVAGSENKFREQLEQMVSYIGKAYDRGRLVLLHQLVTSLSDDAERPAMHVVVTAEDRNGKLVPPNFFKQALVNSERAFEIDEWTLQSTFKWMADNSDELDSFAAVIVPLSHGAMKRDDLSNIIINQLMETAVPPGKIFFEIADKDAIANVAETAELVRTLKEFGCRFILDEFGTGHGNYDYVRELAVDFVTIQSGYIAEARQNPKDFAMAKSINELIHFMGKKTIGKQDSGTTVVEVLREIGVDFIYDQSKTSRIAA